MKNLINYKLNILEILLILSPIIDIATSISERILNIDISIGIIVRALFLAFMLLYVFFKSNYKYKKISIIYLFAVFIYSAIYITNIYINKGIENVIFETKELIKSFFFPICIVGILNYIETKEYKLNPKILFAVAIEYITLLFIPILFNIGFESYAEDKIGSIGWFFSGNEISAIFAILFVFILLSYDYIQNKILYMGIVLYSLYTIMQIGTKIPAIAGIICILGFVIIKSTQYILSKKKLDVKIVSTYIIAISMFIITFVTSPVATNFDIYKNYLISTREEDTVQVSAETVEDEKNSIVLENTINQNGFVAENIEDITEVEEESKLTNSEIATIIHSGRLETLNKIMQKFKVSNILDKLIGLGKLDIKDNTQNLSEIDYCDILTNFGYLGFIIYFMPIIAIIVLILKKLKVSVIRKIIEDDTLCAYAISLSIGFFLCAIAGHTFVAPAVSTFIAVILAQFFRVFNERNNL